MTGRGVLSVVEDAGPRGYGYGNGYGNGDGNGNGNPAE